MLTPKEALIKDGTVPVNATGRGRMSAAQVARVKELVSQGWAIKGYAVESTTKTKDVSTPKVVKVSDNGKTIAELPPMRYDEKLWKAVSDVPVAGKTEFGMRECCSNPVCRGTSLTYHFCDSPSLFGGVPVRIVPR